MFHLVCFGGAKTDSTANENVPAVIDNSMTTSANSRYISPGLLRIEAGQVLNDSITRARITAPSLRQEGLPEVYPVTVLAVPGASPNVAFWEGNGPMIQRNEEFGVECSCGVSTVKRANSSLWLRDRMTPVAQGRRLSVFGTSTQTLLQSGWTLGGITLDQTLPVGRYQVIGLNLVCNDALAGRLVFPRGGMYRPGSPACASVGGFERLNRFRCGGMGGWGEFDSIAQPQLELFGVTAGAETAQVILDLVQVSQSVPG